MQSLIYCKTWKSLLVSVRWHRRQFINVSSEGNAGTYTSPTYLHLNQVIQRERQQHALVHLTFLWIKFFRGEGNSPSYLPLICYQSSVSRLHVEHILFCLWNFLYDGSPFTDVLSTTFFMVLSVGCEMINMNNSWNSSYKRWPLQNAFKMVRTQSHSWLDRRVKCNSISSDFPIRLRIN